MPPIPRQSSLRPESGQRPWQALVHEIIYEADTPAGKAFDVLLLILIIGSVAAVMLESVPSIGDRWGDELRVLEWVFTILFTIEYVLRLICVLKPMGYARSFFGIVDLLAIIPTYLTLLPIEQSLQAALVIRSLRLIRVFRIFKLAQYLTEADSLLIAMRAAAAKITVFLVIVTSVVLIMGSLMYIVEGDPNDPTNQFTSIPKGVYWAVVTMTTVGYGDVTPQTWLGQTLAAFSMIIGYSIIVVPTGIFSVEVIRAMDKSLSTRSCPSCSKYGHADDAKFCKHCGAPL